MNGFGLSEILLILLVIGLIPALSYLIIRFSRLQKSGNDFAITEIKRKNEELLSENSGLKERASLLTQQNSELRENIETRDKTILDLSGQVSRKNAEFESLQAKINEQKKDNEQLQERFRTEFKNLANEIFDEKTKKFTEQNRTKLEEILKPLGEKIREFEKKVEETYDKESKQRFSLEKEIKNLTELNQQISSDAKNLTTALTMDTKKQGNWGELVLERVLESSGLTKGLEYTREFSTKSGEGDVYRPDAVIHLPENKHIIIDSKVSLVAYNDYVNAATQEERDKHLKLHLASIKNHIRLLSEKNYQNLEAFDTPDYVLLFLPIESSFSIALQSDIDLFNFAWEKNVVIVSPTTLLATLRTVASIWKHEKQTQNAIEIARQGGDLYDKFVGFIEDLTEIGKKLDSTQQSYEAAMSKLSEGKGNLMRRATRLKELGLKTSKEIPKLLNDSQDEV
jgi:DNA recombination protein RmuC